MKFHYHIPLPHNVLGLTVNVYRADYNNETNTTDWTVMPTTADLIKRYFLTGNTTDFSTFVPLGEKINISPPNPHPVPTPVPSPQGGGNSGTGGGNGNSGQNPKPSPSPTSVESNKTNVKLFPPKLKLTLFNQSITLQQGETKYVGFNLTNIGNVTVVGATVSANVLRGWDTAPVLFNEILKRQTKQGKIFIKVYDNQMPGSYMVPVKALVNGNQTVDVKMLKVIVIPRQKLARMKITEVAPVLNLEENAVVPFPMMVKNNGDYNLTNITLSFESAGDCIKGINGSYNLTVGEEKSMVFTLKTGKAFSHCLAVLYLKSNEGAITFTPIDINIRPKSLIKVRIFFILFAISTLLTVYVIYDKIKQYIKIRESKKKKGNEEEE
ncbi:MAG: hypothetical protein GWP09_00345 [Nitrospiraceae bacterium]|nr:hypothetical protein [Nitrospiraceae bacterium]